MPISEQWFTSLTLLRTLSAWDPGKSRIISSPRRIMHTDIGNVRWEKCKIWYDSFYKVIQMILDWDCWENEEFNLYPGFTFDAFADVLCLTKQGWVDSGFWHWIPRFTSWVLPVVRSKHFDNFLKVLWWKLWNEWWLLGTLTLTNDSYMYTKSQ